MIIEIFITQNEVVDSLREEAGDGMFYGFRVPVVLKTLSKTFDEATTSFDFSQEQSSSTIARDGDHFGNYT